MKKIIASGVLIFTFFNLTFAQSNPKIQPKSFALPATTTSPIPEIILPAFSKAEADALDFGDAKNGHLPKYARLVPVNITLDNAGSWTELQEGRIWRVKITTTGALGIVPLFENLYLPIGATLHAYMPDLRDVHGAFTNINTPEARSFNAGLVHGQSCVLEYYEPASRKGQGILVMKSIGHAYRWVDPLNMDEKSGSQSCEVNVACSEGNNWRDQIRSVVRVDIVSDGGLGYCSGTLVNNVRQDCTPYILSAQHCSENGVSAAQYNMWNFDFNYQASNCLGINGPLNQTAFGCKKIADSQDNAGNHGSDFLLLQLNNLPDTSWHTYYSGWDHSSTPCTGGVGIHHPEGDIKKISTYSVTATSWSWADTALDTHWLITWDATAHGHGISEPGSSGSPMYNPAGLVVGHLTGGNTCCVPAGCTLPGGPNSPDIFGKLSFDWHLNGIPKNVQLQPWLDPDNTGVTTLAGFNPPCGGSLQNDAGILTFNIPPSVCQSSDTFSVVLENYGDNTLTSVIIHYSFDNGTIYQFTWHGSLYPGGTISVMLPSVSLAVGVHTLTALTTLPNNHADSNPSNDQSGTTFEISASNSINLFLSTDNSGSQNTWQITNTSNTVVASGGPYADFLGGEQFNIPICLPRACYTFTINDAGGDGMHNGEDGNFILTDQTGNPVYATLSSNFFGTESHSFCTVATGIEEVKTIHLSVVPNPSTGVFYLWFDNTGERTIRVYDAVGRVIIQNNNAAQNSSIDLSTCSRGVYVLQIESPEGTAVKKLVLK